MFHFNDDLSASSPLAKVAHGTVDDVGVHLSGSAEEIWSLRTLLNCPLAGGLARL